MSDIEYLDESNDETTVDELESELLSRMTDDEIRLAIRKQATMKEKFLAMCRKQARNVTFFWRKVLRLK